VDNKTVGMDDCGNNFFVSVGSVGKPRAEVVKDLLVEMNPDDCTGAARVADPAHLIASEPAFFESFDIVVAAQMDPESLSLLAALCWELRTPLVAERSYGYLGTLRLQLRDHEIIESKPDPVNNMNFDLRLARPFPALAELADSYGDLATMSDKDHAHTPYAILLLHCNNIWRAAHDGDLPKSFAEKTAYKAILKSMERLEKASDEHGAGGRAPEENFKEALAFNFMAYREDHLQEELQEILARARETLLTTQSSDFEFLAAALAGFMDSEEGGGQPPLTGTIPDMEADNPKFIALQQVYETKAAEDVAAVHARVMALLELHGRPASGPQSIPLELTQLFCKNARVLKVVTTRSLSQELAKPLLDPDAPWDMEDGLQQQAPMLWYVALRGADRFRASKGRYPGALDGPAAADDASLVVDADEVWAEMQALCAEQSVEMPYLSDAYAKEVVRFGAVELHNIAAIIGGVAAQEIVKVATRQFTPTNNTFIYNGIAGCAKAYAF
jgi:amyloid beta precursor protein binding protein 1